MINDGLRVAVVGCGYWGSKHVRVLQTTDGVARVCLVDGQASRLEALSRTYPGIRTFSNLATSGKPDATWGTWAMNTQRMLDACLTSARNGGAAVAIK